MLMHHRMVGGVARLLQCLSASVGRSRSQDVPPVKLVSRKHSRPTENSDTNLLPYLKVGPWLQSSFYLVMDVHSIYSIYLIEFNILIIYILLLFNWYQKLCNPRYFTWTIKVVFIKFAQNFLFLKYFPEHKVTVNKIFIFWWWSFLSFLLTACLELHQLY